MPLYTFIADYRGGTYISQVTADEPEAALYVWAQQLEVSAIPGLGPRSKDRLLHDLQRDAEEYGIGPVLLDGLKNAWCAGALVRDKYMMINFVQTEV